MVSSFVERVVLRAARSRHLDRLAMRALVRANELLGLAIGVRLASLRDSDEPLTRAFARAEAASVQLHLFSESAEILRERWDRVPEKRRPHYRPEQRYRILRLRSLLALSAKETARWFRVSSDTILRWERELASGPETSHLVEPSPPVRRYADVVRALVQSMALAGFGGQRRIARVLARAGWTISRRTVGRMLEERPVTPSPAPLPEISGGQAIRAKRAGDVFLFDITRISGLFGLFRFQLAVVLDVFSRMPVAWETFYAEPSANVLARLLEMASRRFGAPSRLITDQGSQFTAERFGKTTRSLGIEHRFGAIGQSGSIAIIERFWQP